MADDLFTCIPKNAECAVKRDQHGLYVSCLKRHHQAQRHRELGEVAAPKAA